MQNFPKNQNENREEISSDNLNQTADIQIPNSGNNKKQSWLTAPDIKPDKNYNPYRDGHSVFREIYETSPQNFKGSEQLETETELQYAYRKRAEYSYAKSESKRKLTEVSNFSALLALMFVVLGLAIQITVIFIIGPISASMNDAQYFDFINKLNYILIAIQYITIFPLIFLVGTVGRKNKIRTFFKKPETSAAFTLRWCVISIGATYIVSMIFDALFSFLQELGMNVNDLSTQPPVKPLELVVYGFFTVICAPLFEEIMFRGIMLTHLQKYGCVFASVVSGVLFGLIHQNHAQMFFAAALGIIFAIMDINAGSIIPSIIAHTAVNGYSFLSTLIASQTNYNDMFYGDGTVSELTGPVWALLAMGLMNLLIYIFMAAAIILFIVEIVKFPKTFTQLPAGDSMLTAKEKTKAFFSAPVAIITLVILAFVIYMNSFLPIDAISNLINSLV